MPKKLALIPALALVLVGLGTAPVVAAPAETAASADASTTQQGDAPEAPEQTIGNEESPEAPAGAAETPDAIPSEEMTPEPTEATSAPESTASEESAEEPAAASVDVDPSELTVSDFYFDGVTITVGNLEPGDVVTNALTDEMKKAKGKSSVSFAFHSEDERYETPHVVDFTVTVARGDDDPKDFPGSFRLLEDEEFEEGTLNLATDSMSVSEFKKNGIPFTGEGFTPGEIAVAVAAKIDPEEFYFEDVIYTDENLEVSDKGEVSGVIRPTETNDIKPGDYFVYAGGEEQFSTAEFTLTEDSADAALTVSPKSIEAADFITQDKGVTLTVTGCESGADVRFVVTAKGKSNVTAYDNTVKANKDGSAAVNVYGTSANTSDYVGDYSVEASCGDDPLTGSFEVTSGADAGGSDDKGNGKGEGGKGKGEGGNLPRTGAELGALTGGAALLFVGGAAVALTARRAKAGQAP